jgi:hypothetical protein
VASRVTLRIDALNGPARQVLHRFPPDSLLSVIQLSASRNALREGAPVGLSRASMARIVAHSMYGVKR